MSRSLITAAIALGLFGGIAPVVAQGVYVNGVYTQSGQSITVPATGNVSIGSTPTFGTEYAASVATQGGQYAVVPETGLVAETGYAAPTTYAAPTAYATPATYGTVPAATQTYTVPATGGGQTFTVPTDADATYNIVVPSAAPAVTYAQPAYVEPAATGWGPRQVYVGVRGGVSSTRDTSFTVNDVFDDGSGSRVRSGYDDPGYIGSAVIGYRAAPANGWIGYRVELEAGYQSAEVDEHRLSGVGTFKGNRAQGDADVLFGFVNAYGDIPLTDRLALTAGGGVGVGRVELDGYGVRGVGRVLDDSATAFGYHLDAGVSYQITDAVALEAMYRYQSFINADLRTENGNSEDVDIDSHNLLVGARVGF